MSTNRIVSEPYDRAGTPGRACLDCNSAWPASEPDAEPHHHADGCQVAANDRAARSYDADAVVAVLLAEDISALTPTCTACDEPLGEREWSEIDSAFPGREPAHVACGPADVRRYFRRGAA